MSPIRNLSDRKLAFPEIGQIRKGSPKDEAKNRPGRDLTFFRVTLDEKEAEALKAFTAKYGDKPDEINIILPFNEIDRVWDAWLEAYTAGRMVARTDGEFYNYLIDTSTGEIVIKNWVDREGKKRPYHEKDVVGKDYQNKPIVCKPVGRLKVIVPELERLAYLTVLTSSIHDIGNISGQLSALQQMNDGQIAGIPMKLRRRPKKISCPDPKDKTKRVRYEKWMLSIEADPEWVKRKLLAVKALALPGNGLESVKSLPEHTEEVVDAVVDFVDEDDEFEPPSDPDFVPEPPATMPPGDTQQPVQAFPEDNHPLPQSNPENAPQPILDAVTDEATLRALAKDDLDGTGIYGRMTIPELARKINEKNAFIKTEKDPRKASALLRDVDALKLVLEYRKAEQEKGKG